MPVIDSFRGKFRFLSNFYLADVSYEGVVYPSSENAYQASKSISHIERLKISKLKKPGEAKRAGKVVRMRDDWEIVKYNVMLEILRKKFSRPDLANSLMSTKPHELIEGNMWHDNIWGDCYCLKCRYIIGQNLLGKALMQVRDELLYQTIR